MMCARVLAAGTLRTTAARVALASACLAAAAAAQTTWYVAGHADCPGSGAAADPFCTIGAAMEAAAPGDTILVAPGTYAESVVVDKEDLSLVGAGAAVTTILGNPGSSPVGPSGLGEIASFSIRGFRITSADPGLGWIPGVVAYTVPGSGGAWQIRDCVIEDVDVGINAFNAYDGSTILIENTAIRRCDLGIQLWGSGIAVRHCTLFDLGAGIEEAFYAGFEVSDTIIAQTDAWAIKTYWNSPANIQRLLIHDTNLNNPPNVPSAGPFMQYLAEGHPGGFGVWAYFTPTPGPVIVSDPDFVDEVAADVRLQPGSPAIDAGLATAIDPAEPYDVLGFGHPRVDDGDFDGAAVADLGAVEFGGLLANGGLLGALSVGQTLELTQAGKPGAFYGVVLGLPGTPLELGAKGTLFLDPSLLLLLSSGVLPAGDSATVLAGTLPAAVAGLAVSFQDVQKGPGPGDVLHWTNLERLAVLP